MTAAIVIGLLFPAISAFVRPALATIIFLMLVGAMVRVDLAELRECFARPGMLAGGLAWMLVLSPLLVIGLMEAGLNTYLSPALALALVLTAGAPNINSTPSLAGMLGLNTGLALALLVFGLLAAPFTLYALLGLVDVGEKAFTPGELSLRLALMVTGAMVLAAVARRLIGAQRLERNLKALDGINMLMLMGFGIAVMAGVTDAFFADPVHTGFVAMLGVGTCLLMLGATTLAFWPWRGRAASTIAFGAAMRNMGVVGGAIDNLLPAEAWLFIGLMQIGIFLLPACLKPIYARRYPLAGMPPAVKRRES